LHHNSKERKLGSGEMRRHRGGRERNKEVEKRGRREIRQR